MDIDWRSIYEGAKSGHEVARRGALSTAIAAFEQRLEELGFYERTAPFLNSHEHVGVGTVFRAAYERGLFGDHAARLDARSILRAVRLRNEMVHGRRDAPGPEDCVRAVAVISNAVESLVDFPAPVRPQRSRRDRTPERSGRIKAAPSEDAAVRLLKERVSSLEAQNAALLQLVSQMTLWIEELERKLSTPGSNQLP